MLSWMIRRIRPGGAYSSRKTAAPTPTGIANAATRPSSQRLPATPARNPASRGFARLHVGGQETGASPGIDRPPSPRSTAPTTAPSMTDRTTTPVEVATRHARPKTGPMTRRSRRSGS